MYPDLYADQDKDDDDYQDQRLRFCHVFSLSIPILPHWTAEDAPTENVAVSPLISVSLMP
jgi:hypothetical protein